MEISIQEVHSYLNLVNEGRAEKIICPLDKESNNIVKIDGHEKVYFYCLSCKSNFYLGISSIQKVKKYLVAELFLKQQF